MLQASMAGVPLHLLLWELPALNHYRGNFCISSIVTWICVTGSEEDSRKAQCMCDASLEFSFSLQPRSNLTLEKSQERQKGAVVRWWLCKKQWCSSWGSLLGMGLCCFFEHNSTGFCFHYFSTLLLSWLCGSVGLSQHWTVLWSGAHAPLFLFVFSPCCFPHQLSSFLVICSTISALAWLGITELGQGLIWGKKHFLCQCVDLRSTGCFCYIVKQLKGLTLAPWFQLAKPLKNLVAITWF